MELFEAIEKRHSYREGFTDAPVSREDMRRIVEAGIRAPSAKNEQVVSFVIVDDPQVLEQIKQIVEIQLRGLRQRLAERKITLELSPRAKEYLASEGFDPVYGARPLKRVIQKALVQPLAMQLLQGRFSEGDTIFVDVENGQLVFTRAAPLAATEAR
ncbi:MAG: nitroreductase family protein [Chloroflexi bacterium]|nr:nitroreductase family protein [Chloroflexota bacterium]